VNVLKVTKSGCLSHVGRRTASLRTSCAVPGSVGGAEKADCVALRRPAACGVSKNRRERSQADADSWNGLFDTQDGPQRAYRAYRFNGRILLVNPKVSEIVPRICRRGRPKNIEYSKLNPRPCHVERG
jgi:hypothetical protein